MTRNQLYRSVRCNIYAQRELQLGENFGQMCWMGKQLLICAQMGNTSQNFGHLHAVRTQCEVLDVGKHSHPSYLLVVEH